MRGRIRASTTALILYSLQFNSIMFEEVNQRTTERKQNALSICVRHVLKTNNIGNSCSTTFTPNVTLTLAGKPHPINVDAITLAQTLTVH